MGRSLFLNLEADLFDIVETKANASKVIAIDGVYGVGKSFLARRLSDRFGYALVGCDAFIRQGSGQMSYPEILDLDRLRGTVTAEMARNRPVVVESILLRLVLESLGINDVFHIYVKRKHLDGQVSHEELFDDARTEIELIAGCNEISRLLGDTDDSPYLDYQLTRYHKRTSPHKQADVLYEVCF